MKSPPERPNSDPQREAEILMGIAEELQWLADQATEKARAAFARIEQPLPLFERGGDDER